MIVSLIMIVFTGCKEMDQFSPDQVIENALAHEESIAYYGEVSVLVKAKDHIEEATMKEWRNNEKLRYEISSIGGDMTLIVDGERVLMLNQNEKTALITLLSQEAEMNDLQLNPREQIELVLEAVKDTHNIENVGTEKVAGRDAIHMIATNRSGATSFYGTQELWIDKEHWHILKSKSTSGDVYVEMEYTKIQFDAKMDDSLFAFDVPEDFEVNDIGNIANLSEEIKLEQIPEKLNKPALYFPNAAEHEIDTITFINIDQEKKYKDITIDYKRDGLPLMSLTIGDAESEISEEELELFDIVGSKLNIRNVTGYFVNQDPIRLINWQENGIYYSIRIIDPTIKVDDIIEWAKHMKEIK